MHNPLYALEVHQEPESTIIPEASMVKMGSEVKHWTPFVQHCTV